MGGAQAPQDKSLVDEGVELLKKIYLIGDWTMGNSEAAEAFQHKDCAAAYSVQAATQQQLMRGTADAEARLLLASNVTVPSNGVAFHKCVTNDPCRKIMLAVPGHNDKPCGPIVNCQEQQQQRQPIQQSAILSVNHIEQCRKKNFSVINH